MPAITRFFLITLLLFGGQATADEYQGTIDQFKQAEAAQSFFDDAYGYAVFPTIGKGGIGIGGGYGSGQVYVGGKVTGTSKMAQLSIGLQLGGQAYSQIIFFEDDRAYQEFTSGEFEFGANASAVALTVGASAEAGTKGTSGQAGEKQAENNYHKGMAVFTLAKGGLMYEASLGGQKFSFDAK